MSSTKSFEAEWAACRNQVLAYCRRAVSRSADAEDLFQQVAIRAWRGYATFRGDALFLTWALTIARHEAARFLARRQGQERSESPLDDLAIPLSTDSANDDPQTLFVADSWLRAASEEALAVSYLDDTELRVVLERLARPDLTWAQIGLQLTLTAANCAAIHSRAIPKWRAFLFVYHPEVLGGIDLIAVAFRRACQEELLEAEALHFQRLVLDRQQTYRPRGWRTTLRSACAKVARYLPIP